MQVKCSKCSQWIGVSDIIESSNGRLSHLDCARRRVLTPEERHLLFVYCSGHIVSECLDCRVGYRLMELAADTLGSRTNLCPRCRKDLTEYVREHLYRCPILPSEIRLKAQAVRESAQQLIKRSQQLADSSDLLIREAEAMLFAHQQILRDAMRRRITT